MHCTQCGTENSDTSRFCMRCGSPLGMPVAGTPQQAPPNYQAPPPQMPPSGGYPQPAQPYATPPLKSSYPPPDYGGYAQPGAYNAAPHPAYQPARPSLDVSALNIWGPFAGYGSRWRHIAWLLEDAGEHAQAMIEKVTDSFKDRHIPQAGIQKETLTARGIMVENRPYFIVKRGLVSVALYISEFGQDLFISLAAYLKPPISKLRTIILGLMAFFWLISTFLFPAMLGSVYSDMTGGMFGLGSDPSFLPVFLLCVLSPLAAINNLALLLFVIYGVYKWLTDKDFLAGLREKINEFNEDDLMAMILAVEQTINTSMEEIGLDADKLKVISLEERRRFPFF